MFWSGPGRGRAEGISGQSDPGRNSTPSPSTPPWALPPDLLLPLPAAWGEKQAQAPTTELRGVEAPSPAGVSLGLLRSQAFWEGWFRDTDPAPPPAHGPPAEEGPLFPGAPGGCEPPGKAPDRNSSCGEDRAAPPTGPCHSTQPAAARAPRRVPGAPFQPGPARNPASPPWSYRRPRPPPTRSRVGGGPEGGGTGTGVQGQRVPRLGGALGPQGPSDLSGDPRGAPPSPGVPLPPERASRACGRASGSRPRRASGDSTLLARPTRRRTHRPRV